MKPPSTEQNWTFQWNSPGKYGYRIGGGPFPDYLSIDLATLNVRYCLAQTQEPIYDPLVTPGDAIESFIVRADPTTLNSCTISGQDISLASGPRQWKRQPRYLASAVPIRAWVRTYLLFAVILVIVGILMKMALDSEPVTRNTLFGHESSLQNGGLVQWGQISTAGNMIIAIVTANLPQIALTLGYFAYNTLFTRLQAEKEWNSFSIDYRPLRVTSPRGEQCSSYRLQLPYRYSIPLLITSISLHWLVSNTIYIAVIEGGFYSTDEDDSSFNTLGLSEDSFIGIGFSSSAIVLVFSIAVFLMLIPLVLSRREYKGQMVIARANSMIISAACQVSLLPGSRPPGQHPSRIHTPSLRSWGENLEPMGSGGIQYEMEMQNLLSPSAIDDTSMARNSLDNDITAELSSELLGDDDMPEKLARMRLARRKLKWGVVKMAPDFYEHFKDFQEDLGHLSFGVIEQDVALPEEGRWYA
ncbi:hypothetical protein VP1G_03148 [Cytospora mali]|uniref:Uncharacterized protein n=1 Tax=Cytospora mali TaxID=578113 RepID=A0A194UVW5_CYTMA|nr:hypothetical protein VP1G_03148 [Valsa mali var. pyri (nom. inval.)]